MAADFRLLAWLQLLLRSPALCTGHKLCIGGSVEIVATQAPRRAKCKVWLSCGIGRAKRGVYVQTWCSAHSSKGPVTKHDASICFH